RGSSCPVSVWPPSAPSQAGAEGPFSHNRPKSDVVRRPRARGAGRLYSAGAPRERGRFTATASNWLQQRSPMRPLLRIPGMQLAIAPGTFPPARGGAFIGAPGWQTVIRAARSNMSSWAAVSLPLVLTSSHMERPSFERIFAEYAPRVRAYFLKHGLNRS